jgi:hypothetical protein
VPAIPQLSIRFILQGRPQRPVRNSFDHLVGKREQEWRNFDTERLDDGESAHRATIHRRDVLSLGHSPREGIPVFTVQALSL